MQNVIGNVGKSVKVIDVALVVEAAAYATNDLIGGKFTIPNILARDGATAVLDSIQINSKADLTVDMDVVVFSADPSATTFTENGGIAIDPADVAKILGIVRITARKDLGTPVSANLFNIGMILEAATATRNLFGCMISRGAHTPGSTSDITLRFGVVQNQ